MAPPDHAPGGLEAPEEAGGEVGRRVGVGFKEDATTLRFHRKLTGKDDTAGNLEPGIANDTALNAQTGAEAGAVELGGFAIEGRDAPTVAIWEGLSHESPVLKGGVGEADARRNHREIPTVIDFPNEAWRGNEPWLAKVLREIDAAQESESIREFIPSTRDDDIEEFIRGDVGAVPSEAGCDGEESAPGRGFGFVNEIEAEVEAVKRIVVEKSLVGPVDFRIAVADASPPEPVGANFAPENGGAESDVPIGEGTGHVEVSFRFERVIQAGLPTHGLAKRTAAIVGFFGFLDGSAFGKR